MGVEIKGWDSLKRKIKATSKIMADATWDATFDIVEEIAARGASKIQSSTTHGSGELAGSVKQEVVVDGSGNIVGRVWSDKAHAIFREFGTGPVGEASKKDLPPDVYPTYSQEKWFIPVNQVAVDLNAVYGIPKIKIQEQEFYMTSGQPARPWLYPSLKEVLEDVPSIYQDHVRKGLRELGN
ncbi:HK97 gp10 family phage protein [Enterococcus sp. AZ109]|uniref:HK97 gp10 family phage protein n=1 Tax=Enterococcus sp. AZ109 TaxID=2774634 RepID=UPI003F1F2E00